MSKIELLAPAGSRASFEAALKAGADAIYLGADAFGARHSAENFSDEVLAEVVNEAHILGVRVYLTVNTLVYEHEREKLTAFLDRMAALNLDAWILQDLGVLELVRQRYPEVEIHASTQMAAQNLEDVSALLALGVRRVVLPREMTLEEVRRIFNETGAELELFVHGALCVSVSGQCYMSSMIGGRSGNRGQCAQSCRQAYELIELETGRSVGEGTGMYRLSPKDLNTLEHLPEILAAGVTSLKIEGRMKGPEYVYQTVRAYRAALDRCIEAQTPGAGKPVSSVEPVAQANFEKLFNRGFTKGWLLGAPGEKYLSAEIPGNQGIPVARVDRFDPAAEEVVLTLLEDLTVGDELQLRKGQHSSGCRVEYILFKGQRVKYAARGAQVRINYKSACQPGDVLRRTYDKTEMDRLQGEIHEARKAVPVHVEAVLKAGQPFEVCLTDALGLRGCALSQELAEIAQKRPLDRERLETQLSKLGTTAYEAEKISVDLDELSTLPIKSINETRRLAAERLDAQRRLWMVSARKATANHRPDGHEAQGLPTLSDPGLPGAEDAPVKGLTLCASVPDLGRLHLVLEAGLREVYFRGPIGALKQAKALADRYEANLTWQWTRPNTTSMVAWVQSRLEDLRSDGGLPAQCMVSSPGLLSWIRNLGMSVNGDYGLNVMNAGAARMVRALGALRITLSPELTGEGIEAIACLVGGPLEVVGYGHLPVMVTPHCPIRTSLGGPAKGCELCSSQGYGLKDKTGAVFPVVKTGPCWTEILNSRVLDLSDQFDRLKAAGVSHYRLHLTIESPEEILDLVEAHQARLEGKPAQIRSSFARTHGHFFRGVQ